MRRFLVRIIFYSVAVGATLALLSIVTIPTAEHPEGVPLLTIADPDDPPVELDISSGRCSLNLVVGFVFLVGAARCCRSCWPRSSGAGTCLRRRSRS